MKMNPHSSKMLAGAILGFSVGGVFLGWLVGAYISQQWGPAQWSAMGRVFHVVWMGVCAFWGTLIGEYLQDEEERRTALQRRQQQELERPEGNEDNW